jgi:cytochrome c biogenesis protein CcdA
MFITYALGMGTPLILITIFVSKAKDLILNRMMDAMPLLKKLSGIALTLIGSYLILYYFTLLNPNLLI